MTNDRELIKYQFVHPHYQRVHNTITNYANNIVTSLHKRQSRPLLQIFATKIILDTLISFDSFNSRV